MRGRQYFAVSAVFGFWCLVESLKGSISCQGFLRELCSNMHCIIVFPKTCQGFEAPPVQLAAIKGLLDDTNKIDRTTVKAYFVNKPMNQLPKPISIVFCNKCQDVTPVAKDKYGQYCSVCARALNDPILYPVDK